jgi:carnitine O-acetyltransferase
VSLKAIESDMVIVPLDDTKPVTREAISWNTWIGDGRNRFYDKHQCERLLMLTTPVNL